jgi:hypothetical protein
MSRPSIDGLALWTIIVAGDVVRNPDDAAALIDLENAVILL